MDLTGGGNAEVLVASDAGRQGHIDRTVAIPYYSNRVMWRDSKILFW